MVSAASNTPICRGNEHALGTTKVRAKHNLLSHVVKFAIGVMCVCLKRRLVVWGGVCAGKPGREHGIGIKESGAKHNLSHVVKLAIAMVRVVTCPTTVVWRCSPRPNK